MRNTFLKKKKKERKAYKEIEDILMQKNNIYFMEKL